MVRTLLFNLVRRSRGKAVLVFGSKEGLGARMIDAWAETHAKSAKLHFFDPDAHEDADITALQKFLEEYDDVTIICLQKPSGPLLACKDRIKGASVICCMNGTDGFVAPSEEEVPKKEEEEGAGGAAGAGGGGGSEEKEKAEEADPLFTPKKESSRDAQPSEEWAWLMSTYQSFIVWETEAFKLRLRFSEPVAEDSGEALEAANAALQKLGILADAVQGTVQKAGSGRRVTASIVTRENVGSALQIPREERGAVFDAIDAWRDASEHTHECDDEGFALGAAFSQGFDISPVVVRGRPVRKGDGGGVREDCCENMCFLTTRPVAVQLATAFAKACEQYLAIVATVVQHY